MKHHALKLKPEKLRKGILAKKYKWGIQVFTYYLSIVRKINEMKDLTINSKIVN